MHKILILALFALLCMGCEEREIMTLSFEYAALCEGDFNHCMETANPQLSALIRETSSIRDERKKMEQNKKEAEKALKEAKSKIDPSLYKQAELMALANDMIVASQGGPFKIRIKENKDVPLLGDWQSISVDGGVFEFSGTIQKVIKQEKVSAYNFEDDGRKLGFIVPNDFSTNPVALLIDEHGFAIVYGKKADFLRNIPDLSEIAK